MHILREIYQRNTILANLGTIHLLLFILLAIAMPFNSVEVLGLNSLIKPIKFALSIWIYSWTMAYLLAYLADKKQVLTYSWVVVIAMSFEQTAIIIQALRGEKSHFNNTSTFGIVLYALMGVFILSLTIWTLHISIQYFKQKSFNIAAPYLLGIRFGLVYFTLFSFFGAYISQQAGHTVGAVDGTEGIVFLNWSKLFGDLRIAHFFGIHALQIIPLFAYLTTKLVAEKLAIQIVWVFAILYFIFVNFTMLQALAGIPFWK